MMVVVSQEGRKAEGKGLSCSTHSRSRDDDDQDRVRFHLASISRANFPRMITLPSDVRSRHRTWSQLRVVEIPAENVWKNVFTAVRIEEKME